MKKILFTLRALVSFYSNAHKLQNIEKACETVSGGIYKRVDENREIIQTLYKHAPEFVKNNEHVIGWLSAQDEFLTEISKNVAVKEPKFKPTNRFPRPYPLHIVK